MQVRADVFDVVANTGPLYSQTRAVASRIHPSISNKRGNSVLRAPEFLNVQRLLLPPSGSLQTSVVKVPHIF